MKFELKEYKKVCERGTCQQGYNSIFLGLWRTTGGDICETGCPYFNHGRCYGFLELKGTAIIKGARKPKSKYTNADLAKKFNVSKRQVAKMRKRGEII